MLWVLVVLFYGGALPFVAGKSFLFAGHKTMNTAFQFCDIKTEQDRIQ